MRMTNLLAALCIPFIMSCGGSEEPVDLSKAKEAAPALMMSDGAPEPIEIEPNIHVQEEPVQQMMMQQAPIQDRVVDRMAAWCERETAYIERELRSAEAQEQSKYRRYLKLKLKKVLSECHKRYRK